MEIHHGDQEEGCEEGQEKGCEEKEVGPLAVGPAVG
jgi:hypothetical protein